MRQLLLLAAVAGGAMHGEELPKGRVIERVTCSGDVRQSYALYLPPDYTPAHAWPILYCLDPGARGRRPVERLAAAAGRAGWIVAGSNNSRNGPIDVSREAIQWLVRDTHQRFAIDEARVYAAGFSGGARLALAWAGGGAISGVIACGAGFSAGVTPKDVPFRIYATAGVDDFNFDEVYVMSGELSRRGVPQRFASFAGGHDWLPEALTGEALDFLAGRLAPAPPPPATGDQKKTSQRFERLMEELPRSGEKLAAQLRRDAAQAEDSVERRAARRALLGTFVGEAEQGRALLAEARYADAARAWEQAALVQPDNAEAWYQLAVSRAGMGDKRRALDALDRSIAAGFLDRERIGHEKVFDPLRRDPRFVAALAGLK